MLVSFALPRINELMTVADVAEVHTAPGALLGVGSKLVDLKLDLSAAAAHDCPPVSYFRVSLRERAWLRRLEVGVGSAVAPGQTVAVFSTTPDEPLDGEIARAARVTVAGLIYESAWREGAP